MATTDIQQSTNSRLPSTVVTTTMAGEKIAIASFTKENVTIDQYTTLNEVLDVKASESLGVKAGADFALRYATVGIKGSQFIGNNDLGIPRMVVNQHQPTDNAMFYMIPQVVRELSNDLSATDRAKYRLRVVKSVNGVLYALYYAKVIDFTKFIPAGRIVTRNAATGVEPPDTYIPQEDDLHPVPLKPNADGTIPVSDKYASATGKLNIGFTQTDLAELQNACGILFGDASLAATNEYAILAGIDTPTDGQTSGSQMINYTELLSATIVYHVTETWPRDANANGEIPLEVDIGSSSPLLVNLS